MQPRDKAATLGVSTIEFTWKKSLVPREEKCFINMAAVKSRANRQ